MLIKKQNLCLICISKYLQHFNLNIYYKSDKQYIISDILLWLALIMLLKTDIKKKKLNVLFVKIYTEMSDDFWKYFVKDYVKDSAWHYMIDVLNKNKDKSNKNIIILLFKWESNDIIWHQNLFSLNYTFKLWCLVVSYSLHKDVFHIIYT